MRRLAPVLLALWVTGCSSSPAAPPPAVVDAVRGAASPGALQRLNEAVHARGGSPASVLALAADGDPHVRRASVYVAALWAEDDDDQRALEAFLADEDEAIRAMAAGALASLGHARGRAALDALRGSSTLMPWSDPPRTAGTFASTTLDALSRAGR
ncbi:MAG: HEAT repeat domain-containing protein [Vicinamibacterales bacterium]|nr:HEAT repeat domain-containing protein [Vicinamibacterales bacterium]